MSWARTSAARRLLAAVICVAAALSVVASLAPPGPSLAPESASAAAVAPQGAGPLGQALMTAAIATGVLNAIEGSLVYLGAKYESATAVEKVSSSSPGSQDASLQDYASGDVPLPPASAGTNGTAVSPASRSRSEPLVARIPAKPNSYGDSPATYVSGIALSPPEAPERVAGTINAANTIAGRPYVWGGGHGSWYDHGYDCSGAVSFALAGGGFLAEPLTSGQLVSWGAPGPGRWITLYASPSHVYAVIAGLRWDTVGDARGSGPRWHVAGMPPAGFVARHPPGY